MQCKICIIGELFIQFFSFFKSGTSSLFFIFLLFFKYYMRAFYLLNLLSFSGHTWYVIPTLALFELTGSANTLRKRCLDNYQMFSVSKFYRFWWILGEKKENNGKIQIHSIFLMWPSRKIYWHYGMMFFSVYWALLCSYCKRFNLFDIFMSNK